MDNGPRLWVGIMLRCVVRRSRAPIWSDTMLTVIEHARRDDVRVAMHAFYETVDARIAALPGTCWNKGACCRFGEYGHRLYVTALEVCYYLAMGQTGVPTSEAVCPHAHDGKCHVRDRRPLACRIFYCDPAAQEWQGPLTEERLGTLRKMHDQLGVPYFYADWMRVLRALGGAETGKRDGAMKGHQRSSPFIPLGIPRTRNATD